jgi:ABC-type transport system involved in cytochrome bd biosynthesis fused ATPase/permease subunit
MSLRLKLLLLGLATLVLPWAGGRYAREMESALRQGEADSLQALAQTIATSLQGRTDLLYRATPVVPSPTRISTSPRPTTSSPSP